MDSKYCARCSFYIEKEKLAYEAEIRMMQDRLTAAESEAKLNVVQYKREIRDIEAVLSYREHELKKSNYECDQLRAQLSMHENCAVNYECKCLLCGSHFLGEKEQSNCISCIIKDRNKWRSQVEASNQENPIGYIYSSDIDDLKTGRATIYAEQQEFRISLPQKEYALYFLDQATPAESVQHKVGGVDAETFLVMTQESISCIRDACVPDENLKMFERLVKRYSQPSPNKADVPDVASEEMLSAGIESLELGVKMFPENMTQVISNIWEDMYAAALPPLKDE